MEGNVNKNYDFFFWLGVIANLLQIENYEMLIKDAKNNEIMQELQSQDRMLNEQTNIFLKKIVEQNEEISRKLDERN